MICIICKNDFEQDHPRQKYCKNECVRKARNQQWKKYMNPSEEKREELLVRRQESSHRGFLERQVRLAEVKVADAETKLELARKVAIAAGCQIADDKAFAAEARDNADNVTANRIKQFLTQSDVKDQVARWANNRGLTQFDVDSIWAHMVGNPRPIVIAPEALPTLAELMDFDGPTDEDYQLALDQLADDEAA
jgi:hypothetical protein